MKYKKLINIAEKNNINIIRFKFTNNLKGLYYNGNIALSSNIHDKYELNTILAEELGHHFLNSGNILDTKKIKNQKEEIKGRRWGYKKLVNLDEVINIIKNEAVRSVHEIAKYLEVTEEYFLEAKKYYKYKHGKYYFSGKYMLDLDTFEVLECIASDEEELKNYMKNYSSSL